MKQIPTNSEKELLFISFIILFFAVIIIPSCIASATSTVTVESSDSILEEGEIITVSIRLNPDDAAVKSFEFNVQYNESLLNVSSPRLGDFFENYTTFSSNGSIDQQNGSISNIYSLIVGNGNVSAEGCLYMFNVTPIIPIDQQQNTLIQLNNVGITNETQYLPLIVQNLSLELNTTLSGPSMSNPIPANQSVSVSKDLSSLHISLSHSNGSSFHYSISTNPMIGNISGYLSANETINLPISDLSYETRYEWTVTVNDSSQQSSNLYVFTTEDEPVDETDNTPPSGGGGGGFIPPAPPVEETNNPPETPNPPQGSNSVKKGEKQTYKVSSWDADNDLIRFQINWNDGNTSDWSTFVHSNETINFTYSFSKETRLSIQVRAQDEHGLNSSWSEPTIVEVTDLKQENTIDTDRIIIKIDNETGKAMCSFNMNITLSENISIMWDFGDGTILESPTPTHQYTEPGTYNVTVTITNEHGNNTTKTYSITLPQTYEAPLSMAETDEQTESIPWIIIIFGTIAVITSVFVLTQIRFSR